MPLSLNNNPVLVVTTGRAGSSLLAAQLDKLGIHMGDRLQPANRTNSTGHWEDKDFLELNQKFLSQGRHGDSEEISEEGFKSRLRKLYKDKQDKPWGIKVPSVAQLLDYYLELPHKAVIRCTRPKDKVIESMQNAYDWSYQQSEHLYKERKRNMDEKLDDCLLVEHGKRDLDEVIDYLDINPSKEQKKTAQDLVVDDSVGSAKILVCAWTTGSIRAEVANTLIKMTHDPRHAVEVIYPTGTPIERNQNETIENKFLEGDYDYMLFIDDDNPPFKNPLDLVDLDRDIVGLPTPQYQNGEVGFVVMGERVDDGSGAFEYREQKDRRSLQKVEAVGTGCVLVARRVLESLKAPLRFHTDENGKILNSGDFNFCERAKEKGFSVWAHYDYVCRHYKEIDLLQLLSWQT